MLDLHDRPDEPRACHSTAMQSRMVDEIRTHAALNIMSKKAKHRIRRVKLTSSILLLLLLYTVESIVYYTHTIVVGIDLKCSYNGRLWRRWILKCSKCDRRPREYT